MIELTPLARPYAKALFASAIESNSLDDMAAELKTMAIASQADGVKNTIEKHTNWYWKILIQIQKIIKLDLLIIMLIIII